MQIAWLHISTWVGTLDQASHWYGRIVYWDGSEVAVEARLTSSWAEVMRKDRQHRNGLQDDSESYEQVYAEGLLCGEFLSREHLLENAVRIFKEDPRDCVMLIEAFHGTLSPGEPLFAFDSKLQHYAHCIWRLYQTNYDTRGGLDFNGDVDDRLCAAWENLLRLKESHHLRDVNKRTVDYSKFISTEAEDDQEAAEDQSPPAEPVAVEDKEAVAEQRSESKRPGLSVDDYIAIPITINARLFQLNGRRFFNSSTETFYVASVNVSTDDGRPIGNIAAGLDCRLSVERHPADNPDKITRLVINVQELWDAVNGSMDQLEANEAEYADKFVKDDDQTSIGTSTEGGTGVCE